MNVTTREEAHTLGKARYYTGEACRSGHIAERYVSTGGCIACLRKYKASYAPQVLNHELVAWAPTNRFQIPKGLNPEQQANLEATLQTWVIEWAKQAGMPMSASAQETITKMVAYRLARVGKVES